MNPHFAQAYAIAMVIPYRADKKAAILAWCRAVQKAIAINVVL